uniref:RING-type domain-containing protein n=1 Tax=Angiostrongylus cantonensis TaxID=6313 RepID=A0A0K0CZA4_ANGCA
METRIRLLLETFNFYFRNNLYESVNKWLQRLAAEAPDADRTCPICYGTALYPVLTNCGHVFCCECIMGYWRHAASLVTPVRCAICRTEVTVLLPLHWPSDAEDSQLQENNISLDDYNRRFSGDRPWLEYLWDLPVLIPYILRNLFDFNGFLIMFRLVWLRLCCFF